MDISKHARARLRRGTPEIPTVLLTHYPALKRWSDRRFYAALEKRTERATRHHRDDHPRTTSSS